MRILLSSGSFRKLAVDYFPRNVEIINDTELVLGDTLSFLESTQPDVEGICITDEALAQNTEKDWRDLKTLAGSIANQHRNIRMVFITRDTGNEKKWKDIMDEYPHLKVITCQYIRIPSVVYRQAIAYLSDNARISSDKPAVRVEHSSPSAPPEKKSSFLDRFKPKPKSQTELQVTDSLTKDLDKISRGISRIVAVTGHRGSGVTSTAVNVASEASKRGLSAMIIDLDIDYRSTNMYFSSFHERTKRDESMNASLIRTLARPQDYMTTAFPLKENLWLASLGYGFSDPKLIEQFFISSKLVGLLSLLRNRFNLIILDLPLDLLPVFQEALIHIDVFGLCVPNDLYSVLSTLKNVDVKLDMENAAYLNAKSKLIVTKYNDRSKFQGDIFTTDKVSSILTSGLLESFTYEMKVAGHVSYHTDFDSQIETDVPLVYTHTEHERAYGNILLRLLEGVK